jgi:hypothetical protein
MALGIPVILDSSKVDHSKYITDGQLSGLQKGYLNKLFNINAWARFVSFKSDYRLILKSMLHTAIKKLNKFQKRIVVAAIESESLESTNSNFNPYFPEIFFQMASSKKLLLIFSEKDRLYWEFEEKFMNVYTEIAHTCRKNCEIHIVKNANHIFSYKEWQIEMIKKSCSWLKRISEI